MDGLIRQELPAIVASGAFGENLEFVSFETNEDLVGRDQLMSVVLFGTVKTSDGSENNVLIKFKPPEKLRRQKFSIDVQFHNEIEMYEKILPFLLACRGSTGGDPDGPLVPRYFFGRNSFDVLVENDLIILENVCPSGFRLSEDRLFLDYDHLAISLRALAKFHGLSYTAKHRDPVGFREVIADVRDTQFDSEGNWNKNVERLDVYVKQGLDRLPERIVGGESRRRFNEIVADQDVSIRRALRPREPLSVLCHGDYNRNNTMFRYDEDTGRPVDALLFDFGTPRYGSPALDLSFALYMNTTQRLRERRWDDLLDVYCEALAAAVPPGVRVPGRAELDAEMAASAMFGFAHVSFFLPYQMDLPDTMFGYVASDAASECLADVIRHFIGAGYAK